MLLRTIAFALIGVVAGFVLIYGFDCPVKEVWVSVVGINLMSAIYGVLIYLEG